MRKPLVHPLLDLGKRIPEKRRVQPDPQKGGQQQDVDFDVRDHDADHDDQEDSGHAHRRASKGWCAATGFRSRTSAEPNTA